MPNEPPTDTEIERRLTLAIEAGQAAAASTLELFQRDDLQIDLKQDRSPVTDADRNAEQMLRKRILAQFPNDGVLGEEFPEHVGDNGFRWILDPIDGTKSFISGVPLYGTMVAVEHGGRSIVGVILIPGLDEYVYASVGRGAWHVRRGERRPARVSQCESLEQALFCTTDVSSFARAGRHDVYAALESRTRLTRTWGDCYGYLLVATGRADIMIDPRFSLWDAAAVQPILEEAGGTFTDWEGCPTIYGTGGLATNGLLLGDLLALTQERSRARG